LNSGYHQEPHINQPSQAPAESSREPADTETEGPKAPEEMRGKYLEFYWKRVNYSCKQREVYKIEKEGYQSPNGEGMKFVIYST
jgi:hypothetical protein